MKRPNLKRVKKSADDMLGALADNKLMKADFKANLKTVKKEEEKVRIVNRNKGPKEQHLLLLSCILVACRNSASQHVYSTEGGSDWLA